MDFEGDARPQKNIVILFLARLLVQILKSLENPSENGERPALGGRLQGGSKSTENPTENLF